MKIINQTEINSDLSEVKDLAQHFREFCSKNQLSEQLSGALELAIVESVNNIIIHAYERKPGFTIKANYQKSDTDIVITFTDFGKEFRPKDKSNVIDSNDIDALPEGNWGIDLIEAIVDDVKRKRENDSNILTIIKSID